jgi:transposase
LLNIFHHAIIKHGGVKMNLVELVKVTSSEEEAEKFLRAKGILKTFDRCPFCGHQKIGRVRRSLFKYYGCRKEWSIRKDSILEGLKVPFTKFILAVKLFILEVPVNKAYKELELAYNTTHKIYNRIRQCIFKFVSEDDEFLSGEVEMDESYFGGRRKVKRGRGAKGKIPVFGILEREGRVKVEIVKDVTAETLLRETIKKVKRGSIIYTDKFKAYDGLVIYGFKHERIDKSIKFSNGKVYINGIEGFWSYAKERLLKFHGVSREYFVYYLKELEFRYNFRVNLDEMLYNVLGGIK